MQLRLVQVYDETVYINQAIAMVRNNMFVGGALAITVLMLFLRNWRATAVVALAIPISVIGTFLAVASLGRTVNVVSLAGMAFAVGMVVDNAIVVLENIYRHYQMGKSPLQAAHDGAREVWAAVLASTLTTMAVFIPVIFIREEAGQLFQDISVATVFAVGLSLAISLTVVPMMATRFLSIGHRRAAASAPAAVDPAEATTALGRRVGQLVHRLNAHRVARVLVITVMVTASFGLLPVLVPETTYLPAGNRNLVFGFMLTPPGYSVDEFRRIADVVEETVRPYWETKPGSPEHRALDEAWRQQIDARIAAGAIPELLPREGERFSLGRWLERRRLEREWRSPPPLIDHFFFVTYQGGCFMGCSSQDEKRVKPLVRLLQTAGDRVPGVIPFFQQSQIFRIGGGNTAEVQIRGDNLDEVLATAGALFPRIMGEVGRPRPTPTNFDLGRPELQVRADRERAAHLGLSVRDVGRLIEACGEGAFVGDFRFAGGDTVDISVLFRGQSARPMADIAQVPVHTPAGETVPLAAAVQLEDTTALEQIYRVERQRAVTFTVNPPETMSLEAAMESIKAIVKDLRDKQVIPPSVTVAMAGNASKLVDARNTMIGEWQGLTLASLVNIVSSRFFLSVLIVYLLMAALYESWLYPFVIMFSVPLALLGGLLGLFVAHWGTILTTHQPIQQFDVVTFLGFVILVGIVVNNAILLVDQALQNLRLRGLAPGDAIRAAVAARVRPILMTSLTTIAGQLPLAVFPGAGSELYRGLAAVMVGGLLISAAGTLVLVPSVLSVVFDAQAWLRRLRAARPRRRRPWRATPTTRAAPGYTPCHATRWPRPAPAAAYPDHQAQLAGRRGPCAAGAGRRPRRLARRAHRLAGQPRLRPPAGRRGGTRRAHPVRPLGLRPHAPQRRHVH
jgi:HAE1 family hydrophobic/amphiphilic exporter-1